MNRINLEDIEKQLKSGKDIEEIVESFDWKEFESLVAEIFARNSFAVRKNLRFKTSRRYEIDVFAARGDVAFAVDCKEWGRGRYKKAGLRTAVENQEQRVKHLKKFLKNNPIAKGRLKVDKQEIFSVIVTWLQEDLERYNNSLIVPVWKLNPFLNHFLLPSEKFSSTE